MQSCGSGRVFRVMPIFVEASCYNFIMHPLMLYGIIFWGSTFPSYLKRLKTLQNRAIKIVARCRYRNGANSFYRQFKILRIDDLWKYEIAKFVHSTIYNKSKCFAVIFLNPWKAEHSNLATRQSSDNTHLNIPPYHTAKLQRCIKYQGVKVWNSIPQEIKSFSFRKFKLHYKKSLLAHYCN